MKKDSNTSHRAAPMHLSRREFLRLSGLSMAAGLAARYGFGPAFAQDQHAIPADLIPGSPNHPQGWTTTLPPIPEGMPVDPPITVTGTRRGPWEFAEGDDVENNPFTRLTATALGIQWQLAFSWTDEDEGLQKYNLALASGDLPDFMETVPLQVYQQLLEADQLEDITDVYEEVASEEWIKEPLSFSDGVAWRLAEVDGRKMGFPYVLQAAQDDKVMWIRKDWLDAVGMDVPTTIEEVQAVAQAFVDANLGTGGQTIGVGASNILNNWYASLDPIFGAYGVIPGFWTAEGDGLMYDSIRPEMREALALLSEWYANGLLAPDFFSVPAGQVANRHVAGNLCGLHFSPAFAAIFGIPDSVTNDPNAEWIFADIPAGPGGIKKKAWTNPVPDTVFCFRKGFEHVDKVLKQIGWWAEIIQNPANRFHGWEGYDYLWESDEFVLTGFESSTRLVWGPPGTNGGSRTDPRVEVNWIRYRQENWADIPEDEADAYQQTFLGADQLNQLWDNANLFAVDHWEADGIKNLFTTLPTETMVRAGTSLSGLEAETFVNIITGQEPIERFDSFVEDWRAAGGDRVIDEVNAWYQSQ